MATKSRRILLHMRIVFALAILTLTAVLVLKFGAVLDWAMGDYRPLILNGIILVLFILGTLQILRAVLHYEAQEKQILEYIQLRREGEQNAFILTAPPGSSLLATRYHTLRELHQRGCPVDQGAVSAIMMAEESLHQSFPRFVNNVLILTGVFGTVSSLILALVGAGDVLQTSSTGSGMSLLLLGMNTALTTTATAIVCYFFFTFFFHRLMDLQTWVFSQVEQACLLYMLPEFTTEPDAINLQTRQLLEEVRGLVGSVREGLGNVDKTLKHSLGAKETPVDHGPALLAGIAQQNRALESSLERLDEVQKTLVEGFRLERRGEG